MTTRYYGAPFGADLAMDVTEAAATTGLAVEVAVIYDGTGNGKLQTLKALEAIKLAILKDTWPPA